MDFDYHVLINNYPLLIQGMWTTLLILLIATVGGALIGLVACVASLRRRGMIYIVARAYVDFFRTTTGQGRVETREDPKTDTLVRVLHVERLREIVTCRRCWARPDVQVKLKHALRSGEF